MKDITSQLQEGAKQPLLFTGLPRHSMRAKAARVLERMRKAESDKALRALKRKTYDRLIKPMVAEEQQEFWYELVKLADVKEVKTLRYCAMPHVFFSSLDNTRRAIKEHDIEMLLKLHENDIPYTLLENSLGDLELSDEDCAWFAKNAQTMIDHMVGNKTPHFIFSAAISRRQNDLFFALWNNQGQDSHVTKVAFNIFYTYQNREIIEPFIDKILVPFLQRNPHISPDDQFAAKRLTRTPSNMLEALATQAYQNGKQAEAISLVKKAYSKQDCPSLEVLTLQCANNNDTKSLQALYDLGISVIPNEASFQTHLAYVHNSQKHAALAWLLEHAPTEFDLCNLSHIEFYKAFEAAKATDNIPLMEKLLSSNHKALPLTLQAPVKIYEGLKSCEMFELLCTTYDLPFRDTQAERKRILSKNYDWKVKSRLEEIFAHIDIRALSAPLNKAEIERLSNLPITRLRQTFNKKAGRKERATILAAVNDRVDLIMLAAKAYKGPKPFGRRDLYNETSIDGRKVSLRGVLLARGTMGQIFDARYWKDHQKDLAELWQYAVPDHHKPRYEKAYKACLTQIHMIENPKQKRLKIT